MTKPVVHLREISSVVPVQVGAHVMIKTIDHPSHRVTNWPEGNGWVYTSRVLALLDNGGFETQNTIYKKHPELFVS